ncbi:hypothetical protein FBY35_2476 [Streptomyces sp. SLBN-118]|uniref:hypothetical protein n=1 Tax=Streptomyces sp. SLBN-118 TaxID=2768454 RepID=UPI001172E6F5|nr:hypothetical protein [Streptomyces sp. SLBN-118]TQK52050.1 hypothetical protein FBY35_2476 [Streptomyces sp. SLBN-118]
MSTSRITESAGGASGAQGAGEHMSTRGAVTAWGTSGGSPPGATGGTGSGPLDGPSDGASALGRPGPTAGAGLWDSHGDALPADRDDEPAKPRKAPAPRRGPADPVKALMHRHRDLCERAVDPLEIAAGLEAHGLTDRTAARFRHRDVFSLAEELYARVPRGAEPERADDRPARAARARAGRRPLGAGRALLTLLPGAVCALTVAATRAMDGGARIAVTAAGVIGVTVALALCLRRGPLRAEGRTVPAVRLWTLWLLAYAAYGEGLLDEIVAGGPHGPPPLSTAPLVGLALAVAPAAGCARLFSVQARRRLDGSRGLEEFASGTRPLLLGVVALYVGALGVLLVLAGLVFPPQALLPAVPLGTLLFLARLLIVHGYPASAAAGLAVACGAEALAPALLLAGRLPGCDVLTRPAEAAVGAWGSGALPAIACSAAALGLLAHATAALSRASAHTV